MDPTVLAWALVQPAGTRAAVLAAAFTGGTTRVTFDGIGRFDLEGDRIQRYSEVFDRGMALAQQAFEPERLRRIELEYANALKSRPEWAAHLS